MNDPAVAPKPNDGPLSFVPLFARLDRQEQEDLYGRMHRHDVQAGHVVVWHGERGDSMFVIRSGSVAVVVPNEKGDHVQLATIGPNGFFGELSLLDCGPRTATVRAQEACELLELRREQFIRFLTDRPDAAMDMLSLLATRHRQTQAAMRSLNPNEAFAASRITAWQRASDVIAAVSASQWFTLFHIAWFGLWIGINVLASVGALPAKMAFDPFPFGLLTMVVSLEAIFLAICVMVSQNRQAEKDRMRTDLDYQVNVRAQEEIVQNTARLERIERKLDDLASRR